MEWIPIYQTGACIDDVIWGDKLCCKDYEVHPGKETVVLEKRVVLVDPPDI